MRGLILFVGSLLLLCGWAATTQPATADQCEGGTCQKVTIPAALAVTNEKPLVAEDCPGGVCPLPQSVPVMQKSEQPRGLMPRVRNRVRQWRPFGGFFSAAARLSLGVNR